MSRVRVRGLAVLGATLALIPAASGPAVADEPPRPPVASAWKILVLVYPTTLVVRDGHTYLGVMDDGERRRSVANARRFVTEDIARLTSGAVAPELTLQVVARPLGLSPDGGGGWQPDPADAAPERDPRYDSVIVVWDQKALDPALRSVTLHRYAGLTWDLGRAQTYSALPAEYAAHDDANVFKHEWGHAVLFFHAALGVAPTPVIDNHGPAERYVHCPDGTPYVWEDEHDGRPIPNSIYNNDSGFTHDYMSGTVALADDPTRCIGIGPAAWAAGRPTQLPHWSHLCSPSRGRHLISDPARRLSAAAPRPRPQSRAPRRTR
jgi:hypothetical protein